MSAFVFQLINESRAAARCPLMDARLNPLRIDSRQITYYDRVTAIILNEECDFFVW